MADGAKGPWSGCVKSRLVSYLPSGQLCNAVVFVEICLIFSGQSWQNVLSEPGQWYLTLRKCYICPILLGCKVRTSIMGIRAEWIYYNIDYGVPIRNKFCITDMKTSNIVHLHTSVPRVHHSKPWQWISKSGTSLWRWGLNVGSLLEFCNCSTTSSEKQIAPWKIFIILLTS